MKTFRSLIWSVTLFTVFYFLQPGLILRACVPNPTNSWTLSLNQPMPVDQAIIVQSPDERVTPTDTEPRPKFWGLVIAFIIAIIVIAYIISQIIRMLDKVIPPEPQPDPPPNSGNTNYPPVARSRTTTFRLSNGQTPGRKILSPCLTTIGL